MSNTKKLQSLDQFKSWAKESAFVYPSSEIYGGFAAVYDYGHYGILLKNNIQRAWEKAMIQKRDDVVLLDSGIFMHPKTWVASGHAAGFADVLVEDKKTHKRYRADHLVEEYLENLTHEQRMSLAIEVDAKINTITKVMEMLKHSTVEAEMSSTGFDITGRKILNTGQMLQDNNLDKITAEELEIIIQVAHIKSPDGNELTSPRNFNLMVRTNMGTTDATLTEENVVYARAETCQGIYLEYKNIRDTMRKKLPFGIAQVGKAFRNEIVARQFIFRTREFEQMEMQYFHKPEDKKELFEMWKQERMNWLVNELGLSPENLKFKEHAKLVFYASAAFDIEYNFATLGGFKELEGIHDRGDYDLTQHAKFSGEKLDYFDEEAKARMVPHIMETSIGLNRSLMAVIEEAWNEETLENGETRVVLKFKKSLAPIKAAVLPLSRKPELQEIAHKIKNTLSDNFVVEYDETASIGKRYRRQDEVGTPFCITVDFDTVNDGAVTVRDRDTMKQERIQIEELESYIAKGLKN